MDDASISVWLARDHARLGSLLEAACDHGAIAADTFHQFRGGLLRHIAMEEKILLPAAKEIDAAPITAYAAQMRRDHSALAAMLVPTPTPALVARLRALLEVHDALEEDSDGAYARCEEILGARAGAVLCALEKVPSVTMAPYQDGPRVFASIERLLRAAGRG